MSTTVAVGDHLGGAGEPRVPWSFRADRRHLPERHRGRSSARLPAATSDRAAASLPRRGTAGRAGWSTGSPEVGGQRSTDTTPEDRTKRMISP